ncbi:tail protein X [Rhizobium rhizogenes]|uniref:Phage tail protein n=1 Tax=Rhizobium rhizogenes TaxID=359 RepID=A0AA92C5W2_RHIRH|nr:tail protein X [Rhizobium rhizogenes]PVE56290.1 phage tail protein [Rhizobium rhizogenes]PVE64785.1 phage tail protein [Agrobacterium tumefaciens]PVE73923.1 phage tail protein [Sphingomonas sp. TPD3009]
MRYTVAYGGERLDKIAKKTLQTERLGAVEAILSANPGLAMLGSQGVVPAGTMIEVPEWSAKPASPFTLAWE